MNFIYEKMKDYIPSQTCLKCREDGDFLIVRTEENAIEYFNMTAKDFYLLVDGKRSLQEITAEMLAMYEVDPEILENDLVELVRDLQWKGFLAFQEKKEEP